MQMKKGIKLFTVHSLASAPRAIDATNKAVCEDANGSFKPYEKNNFIMHISLHGFVAGPSR